MAQFSENLQSLKSSFPMPVDMEEANMINMDLINLNPNYVNFLDNIPFFLTDSFPENWGENFPASIFYQGTQITPPFVQPTIPSGHEFIHGIDRKRKLEKDSSESSSANSTPQISETGFISKNNWGKGKRSRSKGSEKEEDKKPNEVVHVRARRGQATDSHSVAERIRRGKINERLRCLQDIVPGCYKTMGMAVMLDEIINYVQSLQNQVEFLSMKLTAASSFYDFNSESDEAEKIMRADENGAKEMERRMKEGNGGLLLSSSSSSSSPFDLSFGPFSTQQFNNM